MATVLEIVESVETLLGNRRDVRDATLIAVQDAIRIVHGLFPSPEQQVIMDFEFDQGEYKVDIPAEIDSISSCSYYSLGNPAQVADGSWVPLDKGNPDVFLVYPDRTMAPLKWLQLGRELWIWPEHDITGTVDVVNPTPPPPTITEDKTLIVRAIATTLNTYALGDDIPINETQLVAVRELAVAQMKIFLGQPEVAQALRSFVRSVVNPAMSVHYRTQQHGHTGLKPRLE